jgi:hypothetical protein
MSLAHLVKLSLLLQRIITIVGTSDGGRHFGTLARTRSWLPRATVRPTSSRSGKPWADDQAAPPTNAATTDHRRQGPTLSPRRRRRLCRLHGGGGDISCLSRTNARGVAFLVELAQGVGGEERTPPQASLAHTKTDSFCEVKRSPPSHPPWPPSLTQTSQLCIKILMAAVAKFSSSNPSGFSMKRSLLSLFYKITDFAFSNNLPVPTYKILVATIIATCQTGPSSWSPAKP